MIKVLPFLLAAALLLTAQAASSQEGAAQRYNLNGIAAVVNGDVITTSELNNSLKKVVQQLEQSGTGLPERNALIKQVLERLVIEALQLQIAERNGLNISDNQLNGELKRLASESNVSLTEFRNILEQEGFRYAEFRENVREKLLLQEVRRQMVANTVSVNEQEIDNLLAKLENSGLSDGKYHFAHIMVSIPEAAGPQEINAARARASNILQMLRNGADFTQTAITHSEGQNALEGGDLGWRSLGQVPSLFAEPARDMQPGDISDLLRSPSGFHIIKLIEKAGSERQFVRQTRARHILLKPDTLNTDEAIQARLKQLESRIRSGEDFATLALSNSQDTLSASRGGDLGWISQGETVPNFEIAMDRLDAGQLSNPVRTQHGWHLIQVLQRRNHDSTDEIERAKAMRLIQARKYEEELFLWLRRLRDESYVEYRIIQG